MGLGSWTREFVADDGRGGSDVVMEAFGASALLDGLTELGVAA
jgi:hypothetical protein